jgi:hypothetical protein
MLIIQTLADSLFFPLLIKVHEQICDYMIIKCSNELCEVVKPRMEMTNHLEQECEWRKVLCPHCKQTITFCELEVMRLIRRHQK